MIRIALLSGTALIFCNTSYSQDKSGNALARYLKIVDSNGDSKISKAETDADFKRVDVNGDGYTDVEEVTKALGNEYKVEAQYRVSDLDSNNDGKVSKEESDAAFSRLDLNNDNFIDLDEAYAANAQRRIRLLLARYLKIVDSNGDSKISKAETDADFKRVDVNGDGYTDVEEVTKALGNEYKVEAQYRVSDLDSNNDGKVSKEESDAAFSRLDLNNDNFIDLDEAYAANAQRRIRLLLARYLKIVDSNGDSKISKAETDADFKRVDVNGDGYTDVEEVTKALGNEYRVEAQYRVSDLDSNNDGKVSKEESDAAFSRLDLNNDNFIDLDEAYAANAQRRIRLLLARYLKIVDSNGDGKISKAETDADFKRVDTDGDGYTSVEEVTKALGTEFRTAARHRVNDFDTNNDGKVSKEESDAAFRRLDLNKNGLIERSEALQINANRAIQQGR